MVLLLFFFFFFFFFVIRVWNICPGCTSAYKAYCETLISPTPMI
jgi:hypothetical protein